MMILVGSLSKLHFSNSCMIFDVGFCQHKSKQNKNTKYSKYDFQIKES